MSTIKNNPFRVVTSEGIDDSGRPACSEDFKKQARAMLEQHLNRGATAVMIVAEIPEYVKGDKVVEEGGVEYGAVPDSDALLEGFASRLKKSFFPRAIITTDLDE